MTDLAATLKTHRDAVESFLETAAAVPPTRWSAPRAPGKWSPAQVADHVAVAFEANRHLLRPGTSGGGAPRFLRPFLRVFLFNPVLRRGAFIPGSKTPKMLRPADAPPGQDALLARLRSAAQNFEAEARALPNTTIDHPFFGRMPLTDFVRFQEIHTQHHRRQLTPAET